MAASTYTKILYAGTYAQYKQLTPVEDYLYFCTDNGKLFKGTVDFTDSFVTVTAATLPVVADAVPGKIYYESDTGKFKTKVGNAYVEIGNVVDKMGDSTTSTISSASSDDHVPSSKNVYTYVQEVAATIIGGSDVVKSVAADQTTDGQLIVTKGDDSTAAVALKGVVTTPTWDETSLKLTLPVVDGTSVEVNIPKDIFLESGSYDATNKKIILVLNDTSSTTIEFSVSDLIPLYEGGDTSTASVSIDWDATNGKNIITADVAISDDANNGLTVDSTGLLVDVSGFATTSDISTIEATLTDLAGSVDNLATAALQWGSFTS